MDKCGTPELPFPTGEPEPPEEWRWVVRYEGLYEVSSYGRIRRVPGLDCRGQYARGGVLRPKLTNGYPTVQLYGRGPSSSSVTRLVHKLVAEAFIGPCPPGQEVCHGRNGKADNRASQLRYGTHRENEHDKIVFGTLLTGERNPLAKLTDKDVASIRQRRIDGEKNVTLAREFGVSRGVITRITTGLNWRRDGNPSLVRPPQKRRLSAADIMVIRTRYAAGGIRQDELGAEFGMPQTSVSGIVRGRLYPDCPGPITRSARAPRRAAQMA